MTIFDDILGVIALGSLGTLVFIAWRKAPQLSIVNPASSKEAKVKETKNAILEERMMRQFEERRKNFWKHSISPAVKTIQEGFRRLAGRLTALERRYVEHQRSEKLSASQIKEMLDEAKAYIEQERFDLAEKALVAIVTHDVKNVEAYEMLGRMYLSQKQYSEARESLEFLLTIVPKDASVLAAVGEVYEGEGNVKKAFEFYTKAKEASPNNPKYLDFFISAAIDAGALKEAQAAVKHLQEVNPENQKIEEFKEMIAEQKKK